MSGRIKYNIMSQSELKLLKDRTETLLEQRGIVLEHQPLRSELEKSGCILQDKKVLFPKEVIRKALADVPETFTLYSPSGQHDMEFPHPQGSFYTRTCTGAPYYRSLNDLTRYVTPENTAEWFHLTNYLDNIDFTALPSACSPDVPGNMIDICTLEQALNLSKKHIWIQPYGTANVRYLIEMCQAAAGGPKALREKPIVSFISCSVPVLKFKDMDAEIIYQCAKAGIPVQPCALPTAGANTPVTAQGTALAACADVLAQIIMLELLCPGLPVIATPLLFSMDMKTTYTLQSNTQITLGRLMCMQLFEEGYHIPAHSYGTGTDSPVLDEQNMIERTSLIHMMAISGASVLGGAGQLETAKTISPLQLIIDDEIFGIAKQLCRGLAVDDETLDFEELLRGDDGNGYLMSDHTLRHFHELYRPELFFQGNTPAAADGTPLHTMLQRTLQRYHALKALPIRQVLNPDISQRIHEILLQAKQELTV